MVPNKKIPIVICLLFLVNTLFGQGTPEDLLGWDENRIFHVQFLAVVLFVSFAAYLKYLQTWNKDFLYASLYLFVNFLYLMRSFQGNLPLIQPFLPSASENRLNLWLSGDFWLCTMEVPLILLFIITYSLFLIHFFEFKRSNPTIYKTIRQGIKVLWGIISLYLLGGVFLYKWPVFQAMVSDQVNFMITALFLGPIGLYIWYAIRKGIEKKTRFYWFFMVGTSILILGPIMERLLRWLFGYGSYLIFELGVLIEIAFFYQALSIKEDYFYEEKDRTTRELLQQKQENQQLQIQKMESDFNALKAQMNPHFIFNSLNSLKALIQADESQNAVDYLVKFSALVRSALENADVPLISLEEEVSFCDNYLAIETLRLPGLKYEMKIDPNLDLSFLEVPPFILQPFLENSLRHGLPLKEGPKLLQVEIIEKADQVFCIIEDNGIGRTRAAQLKKLETTGRKRSISMRNIRERLQIHEQIYDYSIDLDIIDKVDTEGSALGTRVVLSITV